MRTLLETKEQMLLQSNAGFLACRNHQPCNGWNENQTTREVTVVTSAHQRYSSSHPQEA
jgi:hypothetical protein